MGLRYLGNINKPGYNPLASNITTGVNVVQYQGIFTTQQQLQAITTGQWVTDPVFDYSTLLLQADSIANGSQNNTFLDSSTNNFTITRNGNTTQGTFSPFSLQPGAWANFFNGSSDYFSITATSALQLDNATAFTIEFWVYPNSIPASGGSAFVLRAYNLSSPFQGYGIAFGGNALNTNLQFWDGTAWSDIGTVSANQWTHVAITYAGSGTTRRYFINGVQQGSAATVPSSINWTGTGFIVGARNADFYLNGYISNFRVVKGTAVYTSNFTPSTTPLTAVTNTQLLTCQSNRFVDNSTNAFSITLNGTPSVQPFSPFAPQFQYTASVTGGSGYFDGTGDYLTAADNTAFEFGSGDFTIEAWVYVTATPGASGATIASKNSEFNFVVQQNLRGFFSFFTPSQTDLSGTTAIGLNNWAHFAVSRSGSNFALFVNGAREATSSAGGTISATANNLFVGDWSSGGRTLTGYMAGLRLVKGTAVYSPSSTTITVPTAPPTAIANTSLLLNYTNAGILDGTMKNNLETVGNASVSTSVVKYGSGSMYFDGNGDALLIRPDAPLPLFVRTADFTVEAWIYLSSTSVANYMLWGNNGPDIQFYVNTSAKLVLAIGAVGGPTGSINIPTNTWVHVAATRTAGYINLFVNGVFDTRSTTGGTSNLNNSKYYVGTDLTSYFNGYIDDMRFTLGVARYITSFTPPTVALPRQ